MRPGLTKTTGVTAGILLLAGVLLPATTSGAAPTTHTVAESGCVGGASIPGTATTSTSRGETTTVTRYDGEITATVIVPVGTPSSRARFMASDKAGNEYFAITRTRALAAATAFNRANPASHVGQGVVYYARTKMLAEEMASNADTMGYGNGVPITSTPQFLATSANGTAFFSSCSQARVDGQAHLDTNRAPRKVWHATNSSTGQRVTSAVSARAAAALAAYHYVTYTPGEVAAYGFNCQVLTANSLAGLIAAFQAQMAAMPYSAYGGDFIGYDTTGTNPADIQMFRGSTQAQANALAEAFGKRLVHGGVFVVDNNGLCASVGPNVKELVAQQNIEALDFAITPSSIIIGPSINQSVAVNVATGLKTINGGDINVGGQVMTFGSYVEASSTSATGYPAAAGTFNATWNMAYYDQGSIAVNYPPQTSQELTAPYRPTHTTLPTKTITCTPEPSALPGAAPVTLLSFDCPSNYQQTVP